MIVAHVAAEVAPWSQTGGLAEVVGALPQAQQALAGSGLRTAVFTPLYRCAQERLAWEGATLQDPRCKVEIRFGEQVIRGRFLTLASKEGSSPVHFLDCPALFDRSGVYGDADGDYDDNALRFAFLSRAVLSSAVELLGAQPDILHCHDWQTALLPVFLRLAGKPRPKTVFTIHNLAYQGIFDKSTLPELDLPWSLFRSELLECFDKLCFLKGMSFADSVTTVSPGYAREIMTPELGCGLDGFLKHQVKKVDGIVNGVDMDNWNPETDDCLTANFSVSDLAGKQDCRRDLAHEFGIAAGPKDFLCGVVSRLTEQKGLDLLAEVVPQLHHHGIRILLLGSGSPELENRFRWLTERFRHDLAVHIGFDVTMSHRIYAGCDSVLMPSRFEPCGLSQLYAMRYGTIPIARAVGGLRDTVIDPGDDALSLGQGTGFVFEDASAQSMLDALIRAARMKRERSQGWAKLMEAAMQRDSSWQHSAKEYLQVYRQLL